MLGLSVFVILTGVVIGISHSSEKIQISLLDTDLPHHLVGKMTLVFDSITYCKSKYSGYLAITAIVATQ